MPKNLENTIAENATSPRRARGDAGEVEQHSLRDQIEVDRYLASKEAAKSKGLGIRVTKISPPGAE